MSVLTVWRKISDKQKIVLVEEVSDDFLYSGRAEDIPVKFLYHFIEEIYCSNNIMFLKVSN